MEREKPMVILEKIKTRPCHINCAHVEVLSWSLFLEYKLHQKQTKKKQWRTTDQNGYTLIFQSNIPTTNYVVLVDTMTVFLCLPPSSSLTELYQNSIKY